MQRPSGCASQMQTRMQTRLCSAQRDQEQQVLMPQSRHPCAHGSQVTDYNGTARRVLRTRTGIFSMRRRLMPMVMVVSADGQLPHAPCSKSCTRRSADGASLRR